MGDLKSSKARFDEEKEENCCAPGQGRCWLELVSEKTQGTTYGADGVQPKLQQTLIGGCLG